MLYLGIDPGKDFAHCALVAVPGGSVRPQLEVCESVAWPNLSGWLRLMELVQRANEVGCEGQWIRDGDTSKWSGIAPLLETMGAVRVACLASSRPLHRLGPSEWRAVSLAPRPFDTRERARRSEREAWSAMWGNGLGAGNRPKLPRGLGPDTGAASLIALAVAGVNVHTWISL